ncbi:hypothetical protein IscW_ISCW002192 [Ixodes scapularis]|uniref:Secreted protein n=1 Tax=Ixodes scapularis TaxID=6945 RepID=B7PBZ6_IXOSC|nr:hypothetical protein IscW_ISCW002192 [Ixodes scapularis]|eukprot:XP_002409103.1 hypothetical protein IscW_ISCW002192 [Ixodes scapularis]
MKFELLALVLLFGVAASAPGLAGRRSSTRYVCIEGLCHALESDGAEPRNSPFFRSLADCRVSCLGRPKEDSRRLPAKSRIPGKDSSTKLGQLDPTDIPLLQKKKEDAE